MLRRRSRLLWLLVLGVAVLLVASGWQYFLHDTAETATIRDAVDTFRSRPGAIPASRRAAFTCGSVR